MYFGDFENKDYSRFNMARFVDTSNGIIDYIDTEFLISVKSLPVSGYINVVKGTRPDTVSNRIYESSDYWWILMTYNNILSAEEFMGLSTSLSYPSKSDLNALYFEVKQRSK